MQLSHARGVFTYAANPAACLCCSSWQFFLTGIAVARCGVRAHWQLQPTCHMAHRQPTCHGTQAAEHSLWPRRSLSGTVLALASHWRLACAPSLIRHPIMLCIWLLLLLLLPLLNVCICNGLHKIVCTYEI